MRTKAITTIKIIGIMAAAMFLAQIASCAPAGGPQKPPVGSVSEKTTVNAETSAAQETSSASGGETDRKNTIGEGVSVNHLVTSDEAEIEITGCPSYGDKRSPYVYGNLTKGDPFSYELICIIIVGGQYYGKKPFNDSPNILINSNDLNSFRVQYSSNDGFGTDWNASDIFLMLVPSGFEDGIEPDVSAGYVVPPSQVSSLKDSSVCVLQIARKDLDE